MHPDFPDASPPEFSRRDLVNNASHRRRTQGTTIRGIDPGRSREDGGTGLGLAIVKHLVEALGGQIAVESELGRGTSFLIDLPAVPAVIPSPTASSVRPLEA